MTTVSEGLIGDFPFKIIQHDSMQHLCGYIGVPPSHPWAEKDYNDISSGVHGGITYASWDLDTDEYPQAIWWVGFDCAHLGDWTILDDTFSRLDTHKWTEEEVYDELVKLAHEAYETVGVTTNG